MNVPIYFQHFEKMSSNCKSNAQGPFYNLVMWILFKASMFCKRDVQSPTLIERQ